MNTDAQARRALARAHVEPCRDPFRMAARFLDDGYHETARENVLAALVALEDVLAAIDHHEAAGAGEPT